MSTLRERLRPGAGDGRAGQPESADGQPAGERAAGLSGRLRQVVSRNRLFTAALALAVLPRLVVILGYRPAILFRLDTYDYLWNAVHVSPNPVNPSGYALFLALLRPVHSLMLAAVLQHVMGLAMAVMVYAVLRNRGVRNWIAVIATLPVLFDPAELMLEHLIMADILALFLMMAAFTVLLLRRSPSVWRTVTAGVLMGASAIVRPTALPLIVLLAVYLLVVHAGWRKAVAVLAAGAVPVVAYMLWFSSAYGSFNLTNSNGLFLWSRTMSFANCSVIKPPANLQALCPTAQPGILAQPVPAKRLPPKVYLWAKHAWQWQGNANRLIPDIAAFTAANNSRAMSFAIKAIEAQPLAYARTVASETAKPFTEGHHYQWAFPVSPINPGLSSRDQRYAVAAIQNYTGDASQVRGHLGFRYGAQVTQPWARIMGVYQRLIFVPGPVFGLVMLMGLAGLFIRRRRTAAAALLWISAAIALVLPIAEHEYTYRYVIPAVPLVFMAAALALRDPAEDKGAPDEQSQGGDVPAISGAPADGARG
ncbi:MAG TPA: glycosyltransferase 87 family protein [Streptosporangiaceae bacterium]|nr:glycosyltransferase 87 family protein [Streptosporangiaceae bacterium]